MNGVLRAAAMLVLIAVGRLDAQDLSEPVGEPVLDPPTMTALGVYWIVRGDDNRNARVELAIKRWRGERTRHGGEDADGFTACLPLLRVEKGAHRRAGKATNDSALQVPDDCWLFAGSVMFIDMGGPCELRVRLVDPDGGESVERILKASTIRQPRPPLGFQEGVTRKHVVPGDGIDVGSDVGNGEPNKPFRGLATAQASAKPGDRFLIHAGTYPPFTITTSGEPNKPIVWTSAGDGDVVIDGGGQARAISASDLHDVWFEKLSVRNADFGLVINGSARVVVQFCRFTDVGSGIVNSRNDQRTVTGCHIVSNVLEGRMRWLLLDTPEGMAQWQIESRGIVITGSGHRIARNSIHHFKDGIDTAPSPECVAIDIYGNEIGQMIDDGIELDGSERNVRCFNNRITDCHSGISVQPVFGGPVYVVRNVITNVQVEAFKMHNSPSGGYFLHNTVVKQGPLLVVSTPDPLSNMILRNNLFIGSSGRALHFDPVVTRGDFDYDGFGGWNGEVCMKWLGVKYATLDEVRAKAPIERHAVALDPATVFAVGPAVPTDPRAEHQPSDLRLAPGTAAIDSGVVLPGINDDVGQRNGDSPDLGAYEVGVSPPRYGPSELK